MDRFTEVGQRVLVRRWYDPAFVAIVERIIRDGQAAAVKPVGRPAGWELAWADQCQPLPSPFPTQTEQTRNSPQSGHSSMSRQPVSGS
jgi:hypothetical protein